MREIQRTSCSAMVLLAALAFTAQAAVPFPPADDVTVRADLDKPEVEIGEPILVRLVYESKGTATYFVDRDDGGFFHHSCTVTDEKGKVVEDPFARSGLSGRSVSVRSLILQLGPGQKVTVPRLLNECVIFPKAGTYRVEPAYPEIRASDGPGPQENRSPKTAATTLRVKDADARKRAANVEALLNAWQKKGELPPGLIPEEFVQSWADMSAERVLATMGEERLIPVFLDAMEGTDWNGVSSYGLMGIADRAKVLRAYEERLAHPEAHDVVNLLNFYAELKAQGTGDFGDVIKQMMKERETYREPFMAFLRGDKTYRHGKLAAELWVWKTDASLLSYLLRAQPTDEQLRNCARRMEGIVLGKEDEPFLVPLLESKEPDVRDMAIVQLLGIDPEKYGAVVRADRGQGTGRFSRAVWDKVK